ncbi:MAG: hypothetical protein ACYSUZ_01005 [Planctomycetota bacterium]|jgi:hypothetical protein
MEQPGRHGSSPPRPYRLDPGLGWLYWNTDRIEELLAVSSAKNPVVYEFVPCIQLVLGSSGFVTFLP